MQTKTKAHLVFSIFYLAFFGLLTSMGASLLWVKGLSAERLAATLFCALLTWLYGVRILRIKQKTLLQGEEGKRADLIKQLYKNAS